jgi:hypothetical protein
MMKKVLMYAVLKTSNLLLDIISKKKCKKFHTKISKNLMPAFIIIESNKCRYYI